MERAESLPRVVAKITKKIGQAALIEEFIKGREITIGIIGYREPKVLPLVEIEYRRTHHVSERHPPRPHGLHGKKPRHEQGRVYRVHRKERI